MVSFSGPHAPGPGALVSGCLALLGLALLALAACGDAPGAPPSPGPAGGPRGTATSASAVAFPQLAPVAGERAKLTGWLEGTLALVDDCLRVAAPSGTNYLLIWPPEVALRTDGGDVRVADAEGRVVARVGERVTAGGGELPTSGRQLSTPVRAALREAPPAHCPGPYWLIEFIR